MKKTKFTKEISAEIEKLYRDGMKVKDIRSKLLSDGIPLFDGMYTGIYYICKTFGNIQKDNIGIEEMGYKTHRNDENRLKKLIKIDEESLKEILDMKNKGSSVEEISLKFGVNKSTIYRALKRLSKE